MTGKNSKFLIRLLLISIILRVGYVLVFPQANVECDAKQYNTIAINIVSGDGFSINPGVPTPTRAPLYPFFLSLIYLIFGHSYTVVRIFQSILSAFTCIFVYIIAKQIFNEKIARISGWLLVFYPILIVYSGLILSETLFTFLLAISILFLIKGILTAKNKYFIESGIFLGLASLTRPVTLLFPFVILAFFIIAKRKLILNWIGLFLVFSVILLPWSFRNYTLFGIYNLCTTGPGYGLFITGNMANGLTFSESFEKYIEIRKLFPEPSTITPKYHPAVKQERILQLEGMTLIKKNLKNYFIITAKRLRVFWWTSHSSVFGVNKSISEYIQEKNYLCILVRLGLLGLQGVFLILSLIGIILSRIHWRKYLILIITLIYFTGHIAFDPVPRYHLPVMPYIFIFVSVSLLKFKDYFYVTSKS